MTVRSLLLVSALSPPFVVTLAVSSGAEGLAGLGSFIIASGLAVLLGGGIFGRWADRSSSNLMAVGAALAYAVIVTLVLIVTLPAFSEESGWADLVFVGSYFLLTLLHTGVRVGRKTYVVDMAEGERRATYRAVSNSAMGVILLRRRGHQLAAGHRSRGMGTAVPGRHGDRGGVRSSEAPQRLPWRGVKPHRPGPTGLAG